jgi:hypothetical protein
MQTNPSPAARAISSSSPANRPPRRLLRSRGLVLAGLLLVPLALSACGGGSSSPATSSAAKEQQAEVKLADFARCMREHGIDATTAALPGGEGHGLRIRASGGPAKVEAAQKACKKFQPEQQKVNLSPQQKVAQAEAVEKFAKCMREHGIEVHAASSEGRISIQIHGKPGGGGPDPESPAFQKAQQTCQKLLPFKDPSHRTSNAPGGSESGTTAAGG